MLLSKFLPDEDTSSGLSDQVSSYNLEDIWSWLAGEEDALILSDDEIAADVLNNDEVSEEAAVTYRNLPWNVKKHYQHSICVVSGLKNKTWMLENNIA